MSEPQNIPDVKATQDLSDVSTTQKSSESVSVGKSATAPRTVKGAWVVWGIGVFAYIIAVLNRSSFGVAGIEAGHRFGVDPAVLSGFVVLQVVVYAGMQIPSGLLLDRIGPRVMIASGAIVMAIGQLILATTDQLSLAYLARVLVGGGDAMTFISVLRLVPAWFADRRAPLVSQLTGLLGQLGQVMSAIPLVALLATAGWTPTFGSTAALGVLAAIVVLLIVRDGPREIPRATDPRVPLRGMPRQVATVWRRPGTKLGFFTHMGTQFSITTFSLMWGMPYLVEGQGLGPGAAGGLLTLSVLVMVVIGPLLGLLSGRFVVHRSRLVLAIVASNVVAWTVVLALPGPAPLWLLALFISVISVGGPASAIGFDHARYFNPATVIGTAQGVVNIGGFLATLLVVWVMGMVLKAFGGYSFEAFRVAWLALYPVWLIAAAGILIYRKKARQELGIYPRTLIEVLTRAPRRPESDAEARAAAD